jgi:hypothetical protein
MDDTFVMEMLKSECHIQNLACSGWIMTKVQSKFKYLQEKEYSQCHTIFSLRTPGCARFPSMVTRGIAFPESSTDQKMGEGWDERVAAK